MTVIGIQTEVRSNVRLQVVFDFFCFLEDCFFVFDKDKVVDLK